MKPLTLPWVEKRLMDEIHVCVAWAGLGMKERVAEFEQDEKDNLLYPLSTVTESLAFLKNKTRAQVPEFYDFFQAKEAVEELVRSFARDLFHALMQVQMQYEEEVSNEYWLRAVTKFKRQYVSKLVLIAPYLWSPDIAEHVGKLMDFQNPNQFEMSNAPVRGNLA